LINWIVIFSDNEKHKLWLRHARTIQNNLRWSQTRQTQKKSDLKSENTIQPAKWDALSLKFNQIRKRNLKTWNRHMFTDFTCTTLLELPCDRKTTSNDQKEERKMNKNIQPKIKRQFCSSQHKQSVSSSSNGYMVLEHRRHQR
jgi:superoxide dismutase